MTTLAVTSVSSLLCQASTCFRMGSKLRCIRSTPTEKQSISENDFECLASTGVNTPETMFPRFNVAFKAVVVPASLLHHRLIVFGHGFPLRPVPVGPQTGTR